MVIIVLICSTAFFAASNYSNLKKLESANTQINELNNGSTADTETQINELKTQVEALKVENEKLKGNSTQTSASSEATTEAAASTAGTSDSGTSQTGSGSTYTIQAGDTGSKICTAVYGEYSEELWQKILDANGMTTSTVYHPGDVLQIP
ncbi:MAG: LysM peptidoglycan-binding domain-containing protein [Clostridia bacterium]|nr:LysM peptidoglycan-binding domain-containing protein [Clostridia bacterium]